MAKYQGISPLMAREIVFQAVGASGARAGGVPPDAAEALTQEVRSLLGALATAHWSPRVYRERGGDEPGDVVAATPLPMAHLATGHDEIAVSSMSAALALAEAATSQSALGRHVQRRQRLLAAVAGARDKARRRLDSLAHELVRGRRGAAQDTGELIYAYLWQIAPGQSDLVVDETTIPLDPQLSASENAQAYFARYRKARDATSALPALAEETRAEIAYLEQLTTLVAQAPGFAELEALAAEWDQQSAPEPEGARPRRTKAPRRPKPLVDRHGNSVYVGRSGLQNDLVTFDIAGSDDTWLHARGVGGSHVVIRWQDPAAPENDETVAAAAALAAWYSAARDSGAVEVDVARRRHVRKIKGGRPGMVTYRNERTLRVRPAAEEELRDVLVAR